MLLIRHFQGSTEPSHEAWLALSEEKQSPALPTASLDYAPMLKQHIA